MFMDNSCSKASQNQPTDVKGRAEDILLQDTPSITSQAKRYLVQYEDTGRVRMVDATMDQGNQWTTRTRVL